MEIGSRCIVRFIRRTLETWHLPLIARCPLLESHSRALLSTAIKVPVRIAVRNNVDRFKPRADVVTYNDSCEAAITGD